MDENEAHRRVGALTAIVQMLLPDRYGPASEENAMTSFRELANAGDPLASAISNELAEPEIEQALVSRGRTYATHEAALRATSVYPYLTEEQRDRARVLRVAEDAVDRACTAGDADPERTIIHALLADLTEHRGVRPEKSQGSVDEVVDGLPEPWRMQARKAMESVREDATTS